jgi:hypothetical protein
MTVTTAREPTVRFRDNPLLLAQARRRLRRREALPTLLMALMLGLLGMVFASVSGGGMEDGRWQVVGVALMVGLLWVLFFRAPSVVAGTLLEERRSGLLDFHRATPTTPWTQAVGYVVGCASREWATAAILAGFWAVTEGTRGAGPGGTVMALVALTSGALLCHALAAWMGLTVQGSRRVGVGTGASVVGVAVAGVVLLQVGVTAPAYLTPLPALHALTCLGQGTELVTGLPSLFGVEMHPLLFTLVVQGSVGAFVVTAVARKLARDDASSFSRPGALGFFVVVTLLMLGGSWARLRYPADGVDVEATVGWVGGAYLVGSLLLAGLLLNGLAPSYLEAVRGQRRAQAQGRGTLLWTEDGAVVTPLVGALVTLVAGGWALVVVGAMPHVSPVTLLGPGLWVALAACAAVLAFVAGAAEYARLTSRGAFRSTVVFIAFLALVVPALLATILAVTPATREVAVYVAALSPGYAFTALLRPLPGVVRPGEEMPDLALGISLAVTVGGAAWFSWQVTRAREAIRAAGATRGGSWPRGR